MMMSNPCSSQRLFIALLAAACCSFSVNALSAPGTAIRQPIGRITQLDRSKLDPNSDVNFYDRPNLVTHADDSFIAKVTGLYRDLLPQDGVILDIMSSHVTHLPPELSYKRVDVHGMNAEELEANPARAETKGSLLVRNLNDLPQFLGFAETASYDAVLCCCGIQYLEEPEAVLAEVARILKPGGLAIVTFTNRFFPTKALTGWTERGMQERARLATDYLRAAGGFEEDVQVLGDGTKVLTQFLSVGGIGGDPFVAVVGRRDATP